MQLALLARRAWKHHIRKERMNEWTNEWIGAWLKWRYCHWFLFRWIFGIFLRSALFPLGLLKPLPGACHASKSADLIFSLSPHSQSDQQLHYSTAEGPYSSKPMSMTLPLHPSLLEHYLPRSLEPPQAPRGPEEPGGPRSKPPYSEGEESDGGERSEGELVVLTDWLGGGTREQAAVRWNARLSGARCFQVLFAFPRLLYASGDDNVEGQFIKKRLFI